MSRGNLALAIALIGVGGLLIWVGYANPDGGLVGVITNAVNGKTTHPGNAPGVSVGALAGVLAGVDAGANALPKSGSATSTPATGNTGSTGGLPT